VIKMIEKCKKCGKPIKENTQGNLRYCLGHGVFGITPLPIFPTLCKKRRFSKMTSNEALFERVNYGALSRLCDGFSTKTYLHLKKLAEKVHSYGQPQPKNTLPEKVYYL